MSSDPAAGMFKAFDQVLSTPPSAQQDSQGKLNGAGGGTTTSQPVTGMVSEETEFVDLCLYTPLGKEIDGHSETAKKGARVGTTRGTKRQNTRLSSWIRWYVGGRCRRSGSCWCRCNRSGRTSHAPAITMSAYLAWTFLGRHVVAVHPVFTVVASGSEDGTIKVRIVAYRSCFTSLFRSTCLFDVNVKVAFSSLFMFLLMLLSRHYPFTLCYDFRSGITRAEITYARSRDTPIQSIASRLVRQGRTWPRVRPICPLNCGTLEHLRACELCGVTTIPFRRYDFCLN
jgi:hypothetical protein